MRKFGSILALAAFAVPTTAQEVTSDCYREDLQGPVEHVEVTRIPFEQSGNQWVEREPRVIRREEYDDRCNLVSREHVGDMRYTYWYDEEGRGRRFEFELLENPGRVMVTIGTGEPPVPKAERERGTLRESSYDPATRVLHVRLSKSGRTSQEFRYTLDGESRVVHEVRTIVSGARSYEATSVYNPSGSEEIVDYEHPATPDRTTRTVGRKKYQFQDLDTHGNWTRRTLYRWLEEDGTWEPREVYERAITYSEESSQ